MPAGHEVMTPLQELEKLKEARRLVDEREMELFHLGQNHDDDVELQRLREGLDAMTRNIR